VVEKQLSAGLGLLPPPGAIIRAVREAHSKSEPLGEQYPQKQGED
jgi:hypothetical protein